MATFHPEASDELGEKIADLLLEWRPVQGKHRQDGLDIGVTLLRAMESYSRRMRSSVNAEDVLMWILSASDWTWEETYPEIAEIAVLVNGV